MPGVLVYWTNKEEWQKVERRLGYPQLQPCQHRTDARLQSRKKLALGAEEAAWVYGKQADGMGAVEVVGSLASDEAASAEDREVFAKLAVIFVI